MRFGSFFSFFFFFNDTATTEIYTLSLHDALPIYHHGKAKIGRHAIGDVLPSFSAVIRAVQAPVVLQKKAFGASGVQRDLVHALPEFRILFGHKRDGDAAVTRAPSASAIVGAVNPGG